MVKVLETLLGLRTDEVEITPKRYEVAPRRSHGPSRSRDWFINTTTGEAEVEPLPDEEPVRRPKPVRIARQLGD